MAKPTSREQPPLFYTGIPTFCPMCHAVDSFDHQPGNNIVGKDGKVLWYSYLCRECGHETIRLA